MSITTIEGLRALNDGAHVMLYPNAENPLHHKPHEATFAGGLFFVDGSDPANGPDYYFRDVFLYNDRIEVIP